MFKAGERVWHGRLGWGVLSDNDDGTYPTYPLTFTPDADLGECTLTADGYEVEGDLHPTIFYKEQTFDMSKPEPEIGTWGYFWDGKGRPSAVFAKLVNIYDCEGSKYEANNNASYHNFSHEIPPHIKELMNGTNKPNP